MLRPAVIGKRIGLCRNAEQRRRKDVVRSAVELVRGAWNGETLQWIRQARKGIAEEKRLMAEKCRGTESRGIAVDMIRIDKISMGK